MDDQIADRREALGAYDSGLRYDDDEWGAILDDLVRAARAYVDLLASDALIIRRDERLNLLNTDLLRGAIRAGRPPTISELGELWEAADLILDALASSQGVEPHRWVAASYSEYQKHICLDCGRAEFSIEWLEMEPASSQGVEP